MLNIYTDIQMLDEHHRKHIFPLLLDVFYVPNPNLLKYYTLVAAIEDADVVILPLNVEFHLLTHSKKYVNQFIKKAVLHQKPVWVYSGGDFGYSLTDDVFYFKTNTFKSRDKETTFVLPSFINDPYTSFDLGTFIPLKRDLVPTVGFVGHATTGLIKYFKELLIYIKHYFYKLLKKSFIDYQKFYPSSIKRYHFLKQLEQSNGIETDFVYRKKYRAGAKSLAEKYSSSLEFYKNIRDNAYTFCMRGTGNFSVRFYEALAMGRIPVLLDTDCLLPFEDTIDWEAHCVIISEKDFNTIADKILEFYLKFTDEEFQNIQINNRALWLNKLNRDTYFIEVYHKFKTN